MLKIDKLKKQYKNFTLNCSMEVKEGMITGFGSEWIWKKHNFKGSAWIDLHRWRRYSDFWKECQGYKTRG